MSGPGFRIYGWVVVDASGTPLRNDQGVYVLHTDLKPTATNNGEQYIKVVLRTLHKGKVPNHKEAARGTSRPVRPDMIAARAAAKKRKKQ